IKPNHGGQRVRLDQNRKHVLMVIADSLRIVRTLIFVEGIDHEDESVNVQDCRSGAGGRGEWRVSRYQPCFGNRRVGRETSEQGHAEWRRSTGRPSLA